MYIQKELDQTDKMTSLCKYYEENKDKKFNEWLKFVCTFERGKQGLVGLLESNCGKMKFVFKISQYINYLVQHEHTVMKGLNEISSFCPHFCKVVGSILCEVDSKVNKSGNPFNIVTKYPIEKEVLLIEFIDNSYKLYEYIKSSNTSEDILYSSIKQILMCVSIAQHKKKFTHYDLHSCNIMMKTCDEDLVFLYVLNEDNQFCVPTYGHYPVIIDFGFSYIKDMEGDPAWASMAHTDVGFMSDRYDSLADPKLFLVSIAYELKNRCNIPSKNTIKFCNIIKNIFGTLKLDWEAGWDNVEKKGASNYVSEMLSGYNKYSRIFDEYDHYCIDILQTLIILPFEKQKYTDINVSYITFLNEFVKIENEIGNPFYNIYILKGIIDIARTIRNDYLHKETREYAIKHFTRACYERINCVSKFCRPKKVHYEKMLCSLYCLARNIEGILYDVITKRMNKKNKDYNRLPLQSTEQIYGAIEANIKEKYIYTKNTSIIVINCINEKFKKIKLNDSECHKINNTESISKGVLLYSLYKNK